MVKIKLILLFISFGSPLISSAQITTQQVPLAPASLKLVGLYPPHSSAFVTRMVA